MRCILTLGACMLAAGCATPAIVGAPAVEVVALAETEPVGTAREDAADDPAIWRNPDDPAASLIVATDKKAGLYVYDLDGTQRSFAAGGLLNNVDLVALDRNTALVVASDRNDPAHAKLRVYRLDGPSARLEELGTVEGGTGEAYGLCLWQGPTAVHAFSVLKDGGIEEFRIEFGPGLQAVPVRSRRVATQAEGCVVDPRDGTLYVGEENAGIWRFPAGSETGALVARIDNAQLVADVEGLAIAPEGDDGGWLVASSQGDNAYARYRLPGMAPAGRFRIVAGTLGATEETDGIALDTRSFGPDYPHGLFVAQDGINTPDPQNFKLVSWQAITEALTPDVSPLSGTSATQ